MTKLRTNPQAVARVFKSKAKLYWGISVSIKFFIIAAPFIISILSLNFDQKFVLYSLTVATLLSAVFLSISDSKRGVAEDIKRQSEFFFGLGIDYDKEHMQSLVTDLNAQLREDVKSTKDSNNPFWLTSRELGNERFLEMLHESAWFSHNLSRTIANWLAIFIVIIVMIKVNFSIRLPVSHIHVLTVQWLKLNCRLKYLLCISHVHVVQIFVNKVVVVIKKQ